MHIFKTFFNFWYYIPSPISQNLKTWNITNAFILWAHIDVVVFYFHDQQRPSQVVNQTAKKKLWSPNTLQVYLNLLCFFFCIFSQRFFSMFSLQLPMLSHRSPTFSIKHNNIKKNASVCLRLLWKQDEEIWIVNNYWVLFLLLLFLLVLNA